MGWVARLRIKLRIGIAMMFLAVVVPLTMVLIGTLFQQNARLARQMADQAMSLAGRDVTMAVGSMLSNLANAVEMSTAFALSQQDILRRPEALRPLLEQLERLPAAYSIYLGMHEDGAFYQAVKLPPGIAKFGPHGAAPPPGAKWVLRTIDSSTGERRDTYLYLAKWGKVLRIERATPSYDPRLRPWYLAAIGQDPVASSGIYVFSGTGRPGLTLSKRLATSDGGRVGVFGTDMSLEALSEFLKSQTVGKSGITFILDEQSRLIGYPDLDKAVVQQGTQTSVVPGAKVDHPVVSRAVQAYLDGAGQSFSVPSGADGSTWLARFAPLPQQFGARWTIGVVVNEDDFIGPLKQTSLFILACGALFILTATVGIVWLSRVLVRPIQRLIGETERIRGFDLSGNVDVRSPVLEIDMLGSAVVSMKAGLASFGTYVPRSLVQNILRAGAGTGVGSRRRPLTVMFSDLQGFTAASETMEPEQVLHWLSRYFDGMAQAIHAHQGTIDKYIGDAVMAMWNAPLDDPDHVANGCRAMLACRRAADGLVDGDGGPALLTRMGLHTGSAMVGNVGSSDRIQYTALGAMVNLASRIESLNKQLGTQLLVTSSVADAVDGRFLLRPFGPVLVAGTSLPMEVFELLGEEGDERGDLDVWLAAFAAYRAREWAEAARSLAAYGASHPDDKACALLLANAQAFAERGTPPGWDGTLRFSSK